ncbi:MAG: hypothetical protein JWO80_1734, partial [Bryobacterales bacterium]|nr:hypothetical protein [Bryobacterales bacterium]
MSQGREYHEAIIRSISPIYYG